MSPIPDRLMSEGDGGFPPYAEQPQSRDVPEALKARPRFEINGRVIAAKAHPDEREDTIYTNSRNGTGIVADGMGGYKGGALASREVVDQVHAFTDSLQPEATIYETVRVMRAGIFAAREAVQNLHRRLPQFGEADTTLSLSKICSSLDGTRKFLVCANVGDSRTYIYRVATGRLEKVSVDHSLVRSLVAGGLITEEEAFLHPRRNEIYRSVGDLKGTSPESLEGVDFYVEELFPGDVVVQTSDGIHDNLSPKGLEAAVRYGYNATKNQGFRGLAENLCERARAIALHTEAPQAKDDDMSAVIIAPQF